MDEEGQPIGQVEIIGWMYQYYISDKHDQIINIYKGTVAKEDIPAATQLFTTEWVVKYMVENSLGRAWLDSHPNDALAAKWKYLMRVPDGNGASQSLSIVSPEELSFLDPCMGSGHILVYAFDVLMDIYQSEGFTPRDAAQLIVQKNLHGLDIDKRAVQLAYFAVMMKARQYADKSLIILLDYNEGVFSVFRAVIPYDALDKLVCRLDLEEPRWDPSDPDIITGLNGFRIVSFNVKTGEAATVKDFALDQRVGPVIAAEPDLYRVTARGAGGSSVDGRWWALALQGSEGEYQLRWLFTWDRDSDAVPGLLKLESGTSRIDWVGMSPKGTWAVIGCAYDNGEPLTGMVIADRELTAFHQIDTDSACADLGLDSAGNEVLVMYNTNTANIDMLPLRLSTLPVTEYADTAYAGTGRIPLVRLDYSGGHPFGSEIQISCGAPGWALISTYCAPDAPEQNWLDKSIVLVGLDPSAPKSYLIAKTHNLSGDYWEQTNGTITRDGKTVLWAANFGAEPGKLKIFLMRLDMQ